MTAADHDRLRDMTAAYVLGALDPAERAEIEHHLESCDACRDDVVSFAPLPAVLGRIDADDVEDEPSSWGADVLVDAVRTDVDRLGRSRRRWQRAAGLAAAAALVLGAALLVGEDGAPDQRSDGVELAVATSSPATSAEVVATELAWGTYLHLAAEDLPRRASYEMWTVDQAGAWQPVGSWGPTPEGRAVLGCSTALSLADIDRIVITSANRDDELLVAR